MAATVMTKPDYLHTAFDDISRAFDYIIYHYPQDLIEYHEDIVIGVPITNHFRINLANKEAVHALLGSFYDHSGCLAPQPGGHDSHGNVWIKMFEQRFDPAAGQVTLVLQTVLWILPCNLPWHCDPIEFIRHVQHAAQFSQELSISGAAAQQNGLPQSRPPTNGIAPQQFGEPYMEIPQMHMP